MPPMHYRTATTTRRGARGGYQESDDFEGLPVRQWRRGWVSVNTEPPKDPDEEDDIWADDPPYGMPKDTHLLPKYTQDLLRAARSSYTPLKRAAPDDEEEDNYETVKREKKEKKPVKEGFRVWGWKQLPRTVEKPLPSLLAKRHKNTITLASRTAGLAHISGPTITRARVRRIDAAGNAYHQTITLTAGQEVDGEIISTEIVPAPEVKEEEKPVKRRPPPPKRKPKGPGRGRKKGVGKLPLPMPTRSQQQFAEGDEAEGIEGSPADGQTPGAAEEKAEGSVGTPDTKAAETADAKTGGSSAPLKLEDGENGEGAQDVAVGGGAKTSSKSGSGAATPIIKVEDGEQRSGVWDVDMMDSYITISDEEEYDEEGEEEGSDEEGGNTPDVDGNTTANFEAQFSGLDQDHDMADSESSEVIQPSSVEEPDDEPRRAGSQEEEVTISKPRFSPTNLLSTSHFSTFKVEGSPLKNVMNLSPTEGSPMDSPAGGASVSGASYFEIQPASEPMDLDSGGEGVSESHFFGGMHDDSGTGNTPLFETVPAMSVSHDTPVFNAVPDISGVPEAPNVQDVPDVPGVNEVRDAPDVTEALDMPAASNATDASDVPEAPDMPKGSDAPDVSQVPGVSSIADATNQPTTTASSTGSFVYEPPDDVADLASPSRGSPPPTQGRSPPTRPTDTTPVLAEYAAELKEVTREADEEQKQQDLSPLPDPPCPEQGVPESTGFFEQSDHTTGAYPPDIRVEAPPESQQQDLQQPQEDTAPAAQEAGQGDDDDGLNLLGSLEAELDRQESISNPSGSRQDTPLLHQQQETMLDESASLFGAHDFGMGDVDGTAGFGMGDVDDHSSFAAGFEMTDMIPFEEGQADYNEGTTDNDSATANVPADEPS